jgi:hypothetical protein
VRRFQVVQEQAEAITVKLVTDGGFTLADRQLLRDEIRRATGGDVEVDLQFVSDIPLTRAGKHNVVVRRIPLRSDAGASSSPPALIEAGAQP